MKLISLKINGFKNLNTEIDFTKSEGISVFVGNNGSGKSNVLEAISAIFYGLYYSKTFDFEFEFELIYKITKDGFSMPMTLGESMVTEYEIKIKNEADGFLTFYFNGDNVTPGPEKILEYLPSQIIALYSGEETRLYQSFYKKEFEKFLTDIRSVNKIGELPRMSFIDKDFWNISLLTMFSSIVTFNDSDYLYKGLQKILGKGINIKNIYFDINKDNLKKFKENEITNFVNVLDGINNISLEKLIEINNDTGILGTREEFYKNILLACNGKDIKNSLISTIDIEFNNGINARNLSEGQKKQILIYFVTEILADKDSIVLLDEPDSYIHVGNKKRLKDFFDNFLDIRKEGEFIMTTHSPTLMHNFGDKHLFYLENGEINNENKRGILDKITDGEITMTDMEIFLNSKNEYLLVTEGKTDKKHLEIAIEKLGIENNFDIYPADGCSKLTNFLINLPTEIFKHKIIIGIYDYDEERLRNLKKVGEEIKENIIYKVKGKINRFGISLPFLDKNFENHKNFTIEFMYSKEIYLKIKLLN